MGEITLTLNVIQFRFQVRLVGHSLNIKAEFQTDGSSV